MEQTARAPKANWDITLGLGVADSPLYPGAKTYRVHPFFLGALAYRNISFFGATGLGLAAVRSNCFRAGPVFGYQGGRNQNDDPRLTGLGNIGHSITAGACAAYRRGSFELSGTFRQAVNHSNNGLIGRVQLDYRSWITGKLQFEVGPETDFGDGRYEKTWFGISPTQSAASGLPVFTPCGGVTDAGAHLILNYRYSPKILVRAFGDFREFVGDDANSPIVERKSQGFVGIGIAYYWAGRSLW